MLYCFSREKRLLKTEYGEYLQNRGKAEYFAIYSPDTGKVYMVAVDEAKRYNMSLRFKNAGVVRSNGKQNWRVSYEEAVADNIKYWWAEDYEI